MDSDPDLNLDEVLDSDLDLLCDRRSERSCLALIHQGLFPIGVNISSKLPVLELVQQTNLCLIPDTDREAACEDLRVR